VIIRQKIDRTAPHAGIHESRDAGGNIVQAAKANEHPLVIALIETASGLSGDHMRRGLGSRLGIAGEEPRVAVGTPEELSRFVALHFLLNTRKPEPSQARPPREARNRFPARN
jgi:hypothetical protein